MLQAQRGGEKHHYLGKSQHLKLDLLRQKCDFYCVNPDGGELNLKKLCIQTCSVHFACGQGKAFVPSDVNFGTLWKILGAVALFLSVQ